MHTSDCKNILNLIPLYIDNVLSEEENDIVLRHINSCKLCKKEHEFMVSLMRNTHELPAIEVPSDFHKNIMVKAQNILRAKTARRMTYLKRGSAGFAAAAVIALSVVTYSNLGKTEKGAIPDDFAFTVSPSSQPSESPSPVVDENINQRIQVPVQKEKNILADAQEGPAEPSSGSGGGSAAASAPTLDIAAEIKQDETLLTEATTFLEKKPEFTKTVIMTNEENHAAVLDILSIYEKDGIGYKVENINEVTRKLAELGCVAKATADDTLSTNYIVLK